MHYVKVFDICCCRVKFSAEKMKSGFLNRLALKKIEEACSKDLFAKSAQFEEKN